MGKGKEGMKYLLLIYNDEAAAAEYAANASPEEQEAQIKPWYDYGDWLTEKGWLGAGAGLATRSSQRQRRHRCARLTASPSLQTDHSRRPRSSSVATTCWMLPILT